MCPARGWAHQLHSHPKPPQGTQKPSQGTPKLPQSLVPAPKKTKRETKRLNFPFLLCYFIVSLTTGRACNGLDAKITNSQFFEFFKNSEFCPKHPRSSRYHPRPSNKALRTSNCPKTTKTQNYMNCFIFFASFYCVVRFGEGLRWF